MPDDQTPEQRIHTPEPNLYSDSRTMIFYSNYTAVTMTPDDVMFRFAQRDLDDAKKALEVARIVISPEHAKRLLLVLANIVRLYETNFGELIADPLQRLTPEGRKNLGLDKVEPPKPK
jgi:hypothetical protein